MTRKTEIEKKALKIGGLSKVTGVRLSTLKFYTEIGILPYEQKDRRLARYYDKHEAMKRLEEIQGLKKKGLSIEEIIGYYSLKVK